MPIPTHPVRPMTGALITGDVGMFHSRACRSHTRLPKKVFTWGGGGGGSPYLCWRHGRISYFMLSNTPPSTWMSIS